MGKHAKPNRRPRAVKLARGFGGAAGVGLLVVYSAAVAAPAYADTNNPNPPAASSNGADHAAQAAASAATDQQPPASPVATSGATLEPDNPVPTDAPTTDPPTATTTDPTTVPPTDPAASVAGSDSVVVPFTLPDSVQTLSPATPAAESASAAPVAVPSPTAAPATPEVAVSQSAIAGAIPGSSEVVGTVATPATPPSVQPGNTGPSDPSPPAVIPSAPPIARTDTTDVTVVTSDQPAPDPNQDPPGDPLAPPPTDGAKFINAPVIDPSAPPAETALPLPAAPPPPVAAPVVDPSTPPPAAPLPAAPPPPAVTPTPPPAASNPAPPTPIKPSTLAPQGGYTIHTSVLDPYASSITGSQLKQAIETIHPGSYLADHADDFVRVGRTLGINPLFILSHAVQESGWDGSHISKTKNNLFGYNAFDSNPGAASTYDSVTASIEQYGDYMKSRYLTGNNWRNAGPSPHDIFIHYSTSHDGEARPIVARMNHLARAIAGQVQVSSEQARNNMPAPPENYAHVSYRGVELNVRTKFMLKTAERTARKAGVQTPFDLAQGSYHPGVDKSGGTHDGGGALDVRVQGMTGAQIDSTVKALREAGFAAWHRTPDQGFSPHIHAIAIGDVTASPSAQNQVKEFFAGQNGLANHGPDTDANVGATLPGWTAQYR